MHDNLPVLEHIAQNKVLTLYNETKFISYIIGFEWSS